jgi:hypothetical protein
MNQSLVCLPDGVARTTRKDGQRPCFCTFEALQSLVYEYAYRKGRLRDLASPQSNRRPSGRFAEASTDAVNQLHLVGLILSQLAKQENTLLSQSEAEPDMRCIKEKMKLETAEILRTIL